MSLVRNGRTTFQNPGTFGGAQALQSGNFVKGGLRNRFAQLSEVFGGYNNGALQPSSFVLPQKSGAISSFAGNDSVLLPVAALTPALPMTALASIALVVTGAQLDQIVQLIASSVLALTGSASLAAAISAQASASFSLSANAGLGGIFPTNATGSLNLSGVAAASALAFMQATAGGPTGLSPASISEELLDNQDIETGFTLRKSLRLILASLAGKVSGAGTSTITIRDVNDTVDRIIATVDGDGNRSNVTKDIS